MNILPPPHKSCRQYVQYHVTVEMKGFLHALASETEKLILESFPPPLRCYLIYTQYARVNNLRIMLDKLVIWIQFMQYIINKKYKTRELCIVYIDFIYRGVIILWNSAWEQSTNASNFDLIYCPCWQEYKEKLKV